VATLVGHTGDVESALFSPDGQRIVTASGDGTARIWESASGQPVATLQGHTRPVVGAAFSSDGERIVTASDDGTVRVYRIVSLDDVMSVLSQ
jgi:WD40 repeat protein